MGLIPAPPGPDDDAADSGGLLFSAFQISYEYRTVWYAP